MKTITINTIPHRRQRYDTSGDYVNNGKKGVLFHISDLKNPDYEFLVAVHELLEWYLTQKRGISLHKIDAFDMDFEARRATGNTDEPGNDPAAPYYAEHQFATALERQVAEELGISWRLYEQTINNL